MLRSLLRILQCCKFRRLEIGICIWTCIYCDYTLTVSHTVVIPTLPTVSMIIRACLFLTFCRNPTQGCAWPPCFPCLPRGVACAPESFSFWLVSCAYEDIYSVEISLTDFWWFFHCFLSRRRIWQLFWPVWSESAEKCPIGGAWDIQEERGDNSVDFFLNDGQVVCKCNFISISMSIGKQRVLAYFISCMLSNLLPVTLHEHDRNGCLSTAGKGRRGW